MFSSQKRLKVVWNYGTFMYTYVPVRQERIAFCNTIMSSLEVSELTTYGNPGAFGAIPITFSCWANLGLCFCTLKGFNLALMCYLSDKVLGSYRSNFFPFQYKISLSLQKKCVPFWCAHLMLVQFYKILGKACIVSDKNLQKKRAK